MAEMYWKKTHPAKTEAAAVSSDSHPAARGQGHGSHGARRGQFHYDAELARHVFESRDRERSGYLEIQPLLKIAEEIWGKLEPDAPMLSPEGKKVLQPDLDADLNCGTWRNFWGGILSCGMRVQERGEFGISSST
jgi:hypothetical protein